MLALPVRHVAGLQVTVRAALAVEAGVEEPLAVALAGAGLPSAPASLAPAPAEALAKALTEALSPGDAPVYLSLVSAQLARALDDHATAALLSRCAAVLVGGGRIPGSLVERAAAAGVHLVRTYGMTETAG
ncbi:MAG: AMP-dependent synthetase, partial [Promicromonosporaceae bacterium]|nr:AMP-dependent synthetase [Promicromonosporaceae bacterium]